MAENSTKHVTAFRERMRQAGYKRLQVVLATINANLSRCTG